MRLKPQRGVRTENQQDVLRLIDRYDTDKKADIRKQSIDDYIHFYNHDCYQKRLNGLSPLEFRTQAA